MKFRKLERGQIEDERWNTCVLNSRYFRHYPLTYYLDGACNEWYGLVGGDYEWVWPIPVKKRLFSRMYQPLLTQQLGPFGNWEGQIEIADVLDYLRSEHWSLNIKFSDHLQDLPHQSIKHTNVEMSLQDDYQSLSGRYNRNVESNIKKAEKAGVEIAQKAEYDSWLVDYFRKERGKEIRELDGEFYEQVQSIYVNFQNRGEARTYYATMEGEKIAALMLLNSNDRLLLFFTHSTQKGRRYGAMHALLDQVIKDFAGTAKVLDFEGSDNENLAFFYSSFGGEEKVYLQVQMSRLPWPISKWVK